MKLNHRDGSRICDYLRAFSFLRAEKKKVHKGKTFFSLFKNTKVEQAMRMPSDDIRKKEKKKFNSERRKKNKKKKRLKIVSS